MKNVLKQLGKVLCFLMVFLGTQVLISTVFQVVYGVKVGFEAAATGIELDENALVAELTAFINKYTNLMVIISDTLAIVVLWAVYKIRNKKLSQEASLNRIDEKKIVPTIVLGITMSLFISCFLSVLPIPESLLETYAESSKGLFSGNIIMRALATVIVPPIAEEIIFRGMMISRLKKVMKPWMAIVISSLLFALVHGHPVWMAYTFVCGIIFAIVAEASKSVSTSILLHMSFNAVSLISEGIDISDMQVVILAVVTFAMFLVSLRLLIKKEEPKLSV